MSEFKYLELIISGTYVYANFGDTEETFNTEEVNRLKVLNDYGKDGWELVSGGMGDIAKSYLLKKKTR